MEFGFRRNVWITPSGFVLIALSVPAYAPPDKVETPRIFSDGLRPGIVGFRAFSCLKTDIGGHFDAEAVENRRTYARSSRIFRFRWITPAL